MFLLLTILFFAFMASRANVQSLKDGLKQSTVIYDKDGDVATKVSTNRTEGVKINELPDYVKMLLLRSKMSGFMNTAASI